MCLSESVRKCSMENASANNHWYFTREQLENTPSRKCGIEASKELSYRQQAANFIQDMGQRLQVTQLCINTAIVYMHRFYMFHSFSKVHRNQVAVTALFLAAKVEEQPRKLEHVVRVSHKCLHRGDDIDIKSDSYMQKCGELVFSENIMLQTLGFEIGIDHPHTYVVKLLQLVKASKDLAQTSYFMATNSLHLTTMCLQYKPTVVACVCIHLACKWSNWKIEPCSEGKEWYYYVDKSVTPELLEELTKDFLAVLEKSPNRLKRRVGPENNKDGQSSVSSIAKSCEESIGHFDALSFENSMDMKKDSSPGPSTSSIGAFLKDMERPAPPDGTTVEPHPHNSPIKRVKIETPHSISLAAYREREKREKERSSEQKSGISAHPELPSTAAPVKLAPAVTDKHHHHPVTQDKRPVKPNIASNELVPHKTSEKINVKHGIVTSQHAETATSRDKNNHQLTKPSSTASATVRSALPSKTDVPAKLIAHTKTDPFVLLTRVDQAPPGKKSLNDAKPSVEPGAISNLLKSAPLPVLDDRQAIESRLKMEHAPSLNASEPKNAPAEAHINDAHRMVVPNRHPKYPKHKSTTIQNSHSDFPILPQVNHEKAGLPWDSAKSNGSSVIEPSLPETKPHFPVEDFKPIERAETHSKHEKRVKHERHKHRHSDKDRATSNHVPVVPSAGDVHVPVGGLKITIPKEKLGLSSVHQDNNQKLSASATKEESPRTSLKIKISKGKPTPENSPSVGAKMNSSGIPKVVIIKDKNAGFYSASHKAEKASRKRQRSPSSSKERNSSSGKSKVHVSEHGHRSQTIGYAATSVKADGQNSIPINPAHRSASGGETIAQKNAASVKQSNMDMFPHQNNISSQQYMMMQQYNPQYYQQYFYPMPGSNMPNMQYPPMQPPPMPPQMGKAPPPLPMEPPPPLPPQPPLPSE